MPTLSAKAISLPPQLAAWVDELVRAGEYASVGELMLDGLRALQERRDRHAALLRQIQERVARSLDRVDGHLPAAPLSIHHQSGSTAAEA